MRIEKEIKMALKAFKLRHLNGIYAENRDEAKAKILDLIPINATVGIGDSTTMRQIKIIEALKKRGTTVLDGFDREILEDNNRDYTRESTLCDVFLTGTNAFTSDGILVNVDGHGNRIAGMFHGHPISIIVVGRNKLVKNLDQAFYRIRNIIAPNHMRIRIVELGGIHREIPCVATGTCIDCRSKDRGCNIFSIIEGKPGSTEINVVVVNEDLGLAWDEYWPEERILRIIEEYKKFVWIRARA